MNKNHNFINIHVKPRIPESLSHLLDLAYNVWTTWDKDAHDLFSRIDPILYRRCGHNPVKLLTEVSNARLEDLSQDAGFLFEMRKIYSDFSDYIDFQDTDYIVDETRWTVNHQQKVAYLCMEYGLHESIPIYSGGLGILAGDYLKAASDQSIPMTAFGLLYKYGYFEQKTKPDGMQEECYNVIDWDTIPVTVVKDNEGKDMILSIFLEKQEVFLKIWKINVGKIDLYLLDSDIKQNSEFIRSITHKLYEADREKRILQEIVLAYGSMLLMDEINFKPVLYHLNEGHSAFIIIELLRKYTKEKGFTFDEATEIIKSSTIFTTHTPVIAGNESFDRKLVEKYMKAKVTELDISMEKFFSLAAIEGDNTNFWLPALAIRFSDYINGVSKLHAHVSRDMWHNIYPNLFQSEVPITDITNGVHLQTWLSKQLTKLFYRYIGPKYVHSSQNKSVWENLLAIPESEIWEAHLLRKEQMLTYIRQKIIRIEQERGIISTDLDRKKILDRRSLTIGFARRFATYKRSNLLLTNPQRLINILNNKERPVQFIFAGKAHPADLEGKKLIMNLIKFARDNNFEDRFIFVEDYDMNLARNIVQGCDVWLNNPMKPMEASGTSGMKAGINGVLNFSVLDGWWPECYNKENGWAINAADFYADEQMAHNMEAEQIYDLIEFQIAPLFYDRDSTNIPIKWIHMMRNSIFSVGMGFNMQRMLDDYVKKFYLPALDDVKRLSINSNKELKRITEIKKTVSDVWDKITIKDFFLRFPNQETVISGDIVDVEAYVYLEKAPRDLFIVEVFYQYDDVDNYDTIALSYKESFDDDVAKYEGNFKIKSSGMQNINVRVRPNFSSEFYKEYNYIKWKT